jgi:hypothetical protein
MTPSPAWTTEAIQAARAEIAAQIQAYRDLVGAASKASGMSLVRIDAALAAFEPAFFNNLVVALDARFATRTHAGPASVELALLAQALLRHGGVLTVNVALPHDADASVLRLDHGERVLLNAEDVEALAAAFFADIERGA